MLIVVKSFLWRDPLQDKERIHHILDAIDTILERTKGMTYDALIADKIQFGGIVYYTMIIGEASYKLSRAFVSAHPEVPWRDISDMRHHLVHGYYQVDPSIVWSIITHDLEPLKVQLENLQSTTDWDEWEKTEFSC